MREIEVKAKISDKSSFISSLSAAGIQLSEPLTQRDVVYSEPGAIANQPGFNYLRVRTVSSGKSFLTLKQTIHDLDKLEYETEISSPAQTISMIETMRYQLFNDLTKTRQTGKIGDYEINVDEIEGLGVFVEIEKLANDDVDAEAVRQELWTYLEAHSATRDNEVLVGYDILMREKLQKDTTSY